jgi:transcriptional regulator with PAS, ATPase and Fis domain
MHGLGGSNPFLYSPSSDFGRMMEQIRRVAAQDTTVLLGGETGTGKTRLAALIHDLSPRREEPFLVVNCGALSANLIESEMFGHTRGAFTGADRDRVGKFEGVGRGTLLLDEIDSLPPSVQAKLLRAVEDRVFEPVGSNETMPIRARLIAASNRSLAEEVAAGRFRADLYYRLNVVSFDLAPLRARPGFVRDLAKLFVSEFAVRTARETSELTEEALAALEAYPWPGNVRELRNVIERTVILATQPVIDRADLPEAITRKDSPAVLALPGGPATNGTPTLAQSTTDAEFSRIVAALQRNGNNRLRAALELGISRMTLYKKLHKYGMMNNA